MPFRFGPSKDIPWFPLRSFKNGTVAISLIIKKSSCPITQIEYTKPVRLKILCDANKRVTLKKKKLQITLTWFILFKEQKKTIITLFIFNSTTSCFQVFVISAASFISCKAFLNLLWLLTWSSDHWSRKKKKLIKTKAPCSCCGLCLLEKAIKTINSSITVCQRIPNF